MSPLLSPLGLLFTPGKRYYAHMKLLWLFIPILILLSGCRLLIPANTTLVIEPFDSGYFTLACGRYSWGDNVAYINEDCVLPEARYRYVLLHELCHAHQDYTAEVEVADGTSTIWDWPGTVEAVSYAAAIRGRRFLPHPNPSLMEDFAIACGKWYLDRPAAEQRYPTRSAWFAEWINPLPPELYEDTFP